MASKLIEWTPRTPTSHVGRELDKVYSSVITTDGTNLSINKASGSAILDISSEDNTSVIRLFSYRNSVGAFRSSFYGIGGRGTSSSPAALQANDKIFNFSAWGWESGAATNVAGTIEFEATENWSASQNGSRVIITAVPSGSTTNTTQLTMDGSNVTFAVPPVWASDPTAADQLTRKSYVDGHTGSAVWIPVTAMDDIVGTSTVAVRSGRIPTRQLPDSATTTLGASIWIPTWMQGQAVKIRPAFSGATADASTDVRMQAEMKSFDDGDGAGTAGEYTRLDTFTLNPTVFETNKFANDLTIGASDVFLYVNITRLGSDAADTYPYPLDIYGVWVHISGAWPPA